MSTRTRVVCTGFRYEIVKTNRVNTETLCRATDPLHRVCVPERNHRIAGEQTILHGRRYDDFCGRCRPFRIIRPFRRRMRRAYRVGRLREITVCVVKKINKKNEIFNPAESTRRKRIVPPGTRHSVYTAETT